MQLPRKPKFDFKICSIVLPDGSDARLAELSLRNPQPAKIHIILDFSDSFANLDKALRRLQNILKNFPREWPLSFFRLSSQNQLMNSSLGNFVDAAVEEELLAFTRNEKNMQSGSFLRPCLEGITKLAEKNEQQLVIVLGDCKLSDFGEVPHGDSLSIIGVNDEECAYLKWQKILPGSPVYKSTGRDLLKALNAKFRRHTRSFNIVYCGEHPHEDKVQFLGNENKLSPWPEGRVLEKDFTESCLTFFIETADGSEHRFSIEISPHGKDSSETTVLNSSEANPLPSRVKQEILSKIPQKNDQESSDIILSWNCDSSANDDAQKAFGKLLHLARQKNSLSCTEYLTGTDLQLIGLANPTESIHNKFDAAVYFFTKSTETNQIEQIVGVGLRKSNTAKIPNGLGHTSEIELQTEIAISFSRTQQRWTAQFEDDERLPYEFDMYNCELLEISSTSTKRCLILFSGDLSF